MFFSVAGPLYNANGTKEIKAVIQTHLQDVGCP